MKKLILIISMIIIARAPDAGAQQLGNAGAGLEFAKSACAECHGISEEKPISPNPIAPNFKEIANTPGMNERALVVWFRTPHPSMPNFILEIQNEEDVIAYIMSLKDEK